MKDRARFLDITRGSVLECAAIRDLLIALKGLDNVMNIKLKGKLAPFVSMLTRMAMKFDDISEPDARYFSSADFEHGLRLSAEPV